MSRTTSAVFACAVLCLAACDHDAPTATSGQLPRIVTRPVATAGGMPEAMAPPPPVQISERQVREELAAIGTKDPIKDSDFDRLLKLFGSAKTDVAFKYLSAEALHIALEQRGTARTTMIRRLIRAQATADVTPGLTIGPQASAECHVDFDDPQSIADLPNQAEDMFATHYAQPCGDGDEVRVEPMQYGHFHLSYEDLTIDCVDEDGMFGHGAPGSCTPLADPSAEPRRVQSHDPTQVIKVYRKALLGAARTFSMVSFVNYGGEPVKFRYRKGATWYEWGNLAGNTTWDVAAWVVDVDEVQITHAFAVPSCGPDWEAGGPGGGCPPWGGAITLDNFRINP